MIRYTTDGSDPKLKGGAYEGPFVIPEGTRFVLAYAEHKGVVSEVHKREITWQRVEEERPIYKDKSVTWRPSEGLSFSTTRTAYGFIERLKKHHARAGVQRIAVLNGQWADLNLADGLLLDGEQIEQTVEQLRSLLEAGEVNIEAGSIWFASGQQLLDYVQEVKVDLNRSEVEQ